MFLDDVDGSEAAETIRFGVDGVAYEIDLSDKNAQRLRDSMGRWTNAARRTGGRAVRRPAAPAGGDSPLGDGSRAGDAAQRIAIREWARSRGDKIADRGRIPDHIVDAFHAAQGRR
jgi:hypothetical protein